MYVYLPVPDSVEPVFEELPYHGRDLVKPWHITLIHIPSNDRRIAAKVFADVMTIATMYKPFRVKTTTKYMTWPTAGGNCLVVPMRAHSTMVETASQLRAMMLIRDIEFSSEFGFNPHVTVAHTKHDAKGSITAQSWKVEEIRLYNAGHVYSASLRDK